MRRASWIALACTVVFGSAVAAVVDFERVRNAWWTRAASLEIGVGSLQGGDLCGGESSVAFSFLSRTDPSRLAWQVWYQDLSWPCGEADLSTRLFEALGEQPERWKWSEGDCAALTERKCLRRLAAGRDAHRGTVVRELGRYPPTEASWTLVDELDLGDLLDPDHRDRRAFGRAPLEALSEVLERAVTMEDGPRDAVERFLARVRRFDFEGAPDAVYASWRRVEVRCSGDIDSACVAAVVPFSLVLGADRWPPEDGESEALVQTVSPWLDRLASHCGGMFARGFESRLLRWSVWSTTDADLALAATRLVRDPILQPFLQQMLSDPSQTFPEEAMEATARLCEDRI